MLEVGILILSLGIILFSAELFTNGVEWMGKRWGLSEGAVGCVLAAVGTALPETMVPIIAVLSGGGRESATEIGIGAIVGAPFMLGTLALFVTGVAAYAFAYRRQSTKMLIDKEVMQRDLTFFILVYSMAIITAFLNNHTVKIFVAFLLIALYILYVLRTLKSGQVCDCEDINPLFLTKSHPYPPTKIILLQVGLALVGIMAGAKFFVDAVEVLSSQIGMSPLILSLLVTPIATELPEKFNSIIWVRQNKDTLALGNITGAMVFQSSIIPAIGIFLTPWTFTWDAVPLLSAIFALSSAGVLLLTLKIQRSIYAANLLLGGVFYVLFLFIIFWKVY